MADNTTLNAGSGGDTIASDDIAGVKHQLVKLEYGADGAATQVSSSNPLPVLATGAGAHDSIVSGNPVLVGVEARTTNPTAVSDGDLVRPQADKEGRLVTIGSPRELLSHATVTITASTGETDVLPAGGANVYLDLRKVVIANTSGTAARVDLRDAAAGTIRLSVYVPAGDTRVVDLGDTPIPQAAANNKWTAQSSASITDLRVFLLASKAK